MNHVFIYALPTSQEKDARISEISAVRVSGFGPYRKAHIQTAYTDTNVNAKLMKELYARIVTPEPFVLVSYSKEITRALLRIENEKTGSEDKFAGRSWLDVNDLAWPLVVSGQLHSRTLEALAAHFGVMLTTHSDSSDIVTALLSIYGSMMTRYNTALKGESMLREAGGETLQGLRNMLGF